MSYASSARSIDRRDECLNTIGKLQPLLLTPNNPSGQRQLQQLQSARQGARQAPS